jgi:agmatine deiminase
MDDTLVFRTPLEAGFRMPAEWRPHECCWMAWPSRADLWGVEELPLVQDAYACVARSIRMFEPVHMIADAASVDSARRACGPQIKIVCLPIDDAWIRDSGPTFLVGAGGAVAGTAWRFNAWGGKSPRYGEDARLASRILTSVRAQVYHSSLCLEGGGIHTDGEGTIVTTESVVLNRNRNPGITKQEAERELCQALGAAKVIWLPGDPDAVHVDITDGHIDGMVCFTRPGVVLYESDPGATGAAAQLAAENRRALECASDARGRALQLIPIDEAYEVRTEHRLFSRSYVNFYVANGGIVMPKFGVPGDGRALQVVQAAYPDRKVVQVDICSIAAGGGGIHCITQQQPAPSVRDEVA